MDRPVDVTEGKPSRENRDDCPCGARARAVPTSVGFRGLTVAPGIMPTSRPIGIARDRYTGMLPCRLPPKRSAT